MRHLFGTLYLGALLTLSTPGQADPAVKLTVRHDEGVKEYQGRAIRGKEVKTTASSVLCEKTGFCHQPDRLVDGRKETAWCEGAPGKGVGQSVVLQLSRPRRITSIAFLPFYAKNKKVLFGNAQVKELEIATDEGRFLVAFSAEDPASTFAGNQLDHSFPYVELTTDPRVRHAITTQRVELTVKAVHSGRAFEDLCMSEVTLYAR